MRCRDCLVNARLAFKLTTNVHVPHSAFVGAISAIMTHVTMSFLNLCFASSMSHCFQFSCV